MALKKSDAQEMASLEAKLAAESAQAEAEAQAQAEAEAEAEAEAQAQAEAEAQAQAEAEAQAQAEAEAQAQAEAAEKAKPAVEEAETLVKVENLSHSTLFQHSTGLSIAGKSVKSLRNDGWLQNQVAAKLLKRV